MANTTKGLYFTKGRALEFEKELRRVERVFIERVAAAEARAAAAEERCNAIFDAILRTRTIKPTGGTK